jgi:hypothetical protein
MTKSIRDGFHAYCDQLYNLQSDKGEQQNVANEHQGIIGTLKQQLEEAKNIQHDRAGVARENEINKKRGYQL